MGQGVAHLRGDLMVIGYAAAAQLELHLWHPDAGSAPRLALLAAVLGLLGRHRLPRAVPLACAGLAAVVSSADVGDSTGFGIVVAAACAALLGRQGRRAVPHLAALVALVVTGTVIEGSQTSDVLTAPLLLVAVAAVAAGLFRAQRQVEDVRAKVRQLHAARDDGPAVVVGQERRRVARELHDVVSHHLTVAALQASGARVQLQNVGPSGEVVDALQATEEAGRRALSELRQLLGVVGGDPGLAPQPGLRDIPALLQSVREAGVGVTFRGTDLQDLALAAGRDAVAYRLLQEALTNAVRHGRGPVDVHVEQVDDVLFVEVANEVALAPTGGGGHGLVGMRERVELYGGRIGHGRQGSRWVLRAELPVRTSGVPA